MEYVDTLHYVMTGKVLHQRSVLVVYGLWNKTISCEVDRSRFELVHGKNGMPIDRIH